jgi:hypothetical protein
MTDQVWIRGIVRRWRWTATFHPADGTLADTADIEFTRHDLCRNTDMRSVGIGETVWRRSSDGAITSENPDGSQFDKGE